MLDHLRQDIHGAVRGLRRYPFAALVAVVSLSGGIGATTATLIVRDVVFHRPPVLYRAPGELSIAQIGTPDRPIVPLGSLVPAPLVVIWREAARDAGARRFGVLAAASEERGREVRTTDREETVRVRPVTPDLFNVLGVDAALGRTFPETADPRTAVLSYRVWQYLLGGTPDAIGRTIWIVNQPYTVIGVMPDRFWFSSMNAAIWSPLDPAAVPADSRLDVVVRRQPGVTPAQLAQQLRRGLAEYGER